MKDHHLFSTTKGQRRPFLLFTLVLPWLADEWNSPQTRHWESQRPWRKPYKSCVYPSFPEQQTLRMFRSGPQTINRCGFLSLSTGVPHSFTNIPTHTQSLCTTVASSVHTIHPPQWPGTAYTMLQHILTPQQFTLGLWQLIVYATVALQGHHSLSVGGSVHLSVRRRQMAWTAKPEMESKVFWGHQAIVGVFVCADSDCVIPWTHHQGSYYVQSIWSDVISVTNILLSTKSSLRNYCFLLFGFCVQKIWIHHQHS